MRRERGKIKESPHTLPSNIIRLSLMALLKFLPCVCDLLFLIFFIFCQCVCYPAAYISLYLHTHMRVHVGSGLLVFLWHAARCCLWAAPPSAPSILSKTSKLPSSAVHEGAALCLMSLLFCSDLPPPKPHTSTVIHSGSDKGKKHDGGEKKKKKKTNIWSVLEQRVSNHLLNQSLTLLAPVEGEGWCYLIF